MVFSFEVGNTEIHKVLYDFNQNLGTVYIDVDGIRIISDFRLFSFKLTKSYTFEVGSSEVHKVRIEQRRKLILGGIRPYRLRVFIDEELVHEQVGKGNAVKIVSKGVRSTK